jgi:hypothetical protein
VRKAQDKKRQIAKRDHNDNCNKRRKAGEQGVSSDEDPPPDRRGAAMSPAWRSTGETCRGHPRRRRPVALKCRCRADCGMQGMKKLWARAHVRWLPLPEWTSGRSAPVRCPAERALPGRRDLCPTKPTLREGRRSDRCLSASFMTAQTGLTPTPCRGAGRRGGRRIRRRRRACRRQRNRVLPCGACSCCLFGAAEPRISMCPSSPAGAMVQLRSLWKSEGQPPSHWGECWRRRGGRPKRRSARDSGLKTCRSRAGLEVRRPRAGHVGPPGEESPSALQDVSLRLQLLPAMTLPTCLLMLAFVFS